MNKHPALLLLLGLAVGAVVGYWAHRSAAPTANAPPIGTHATSSANAERRVLYWYDPMKPEQHFDKPGKSPYMDMELVPKYAGDDGRRAGGVALDATLVQNLGIRTALVERGTLQRRVHAVGTVGYDENAVAVVQARTAGYIARLRVRAPLTPVHRGDALAELVAPEWSAAELEYAALQHTPHVDAALRAAARERLHVLGIPQSEIAAVERTGEAPARITLSAPIDGIVSELDARDGMAVAPGTPLFRIGGLARVWVTAELPEAQAAAVRENAAATIRVPARPGRDFPGRVIGVLPSVSAATRTLPVRIDVANADAALSPGMFADIEFAPASETPALLVPTQAIIHTGTRNVVIVANEHAYRAAEVRTGAESDGNTEVLDGLAAGERIVLSGQFLIDSEASLRATLTRLGAPSSEPAP